MDNIEILRAIQKQKPFIIWIDDKPYNKSEAIENILKERQADKEKIKKLEEELEMYKDIKKIANSKITKIKLASSDDYISKALIEEEINRLKYDVSKIKEIKQTRYSDYDRIRLSAYVTKSNEIIKRLEELLQNN